MGSRGTEPPPEPTPGPSGSDPEESVAMSEVLGALSYALDIVEGQPPGHTVRSCLLGMRIGASLGLDPAALTDLYYTLLLKDAGCSANSASTAELFASDDHTVKRNLKTVDWARWLDSALYGMRNAAIGGSWLQRAVRTVRIAAAGKPAASDLVRTRCERGAEIADKLGFPQPTSRAVRCLDEHWDGAGNPEGLEGDAIPLYSRIALLAQTLDVFVIEAGYDEALDVVEARRGAWFDPALVDVVSTWRTAFDGWNEVYGPDVRSHLAAAEPRAHTRTLDAAGLDRVAEGFAEIIDAKSPFTFRHSANVARYAVGLAEALEAAYGMDAAMLRSLRRAGLLHDIGKLAVSNRILDKPGRLTEEELRATRRHPVQTWTILSQVAGFDPIARMAAVHHERLDGSGYPWGFGADKLDLPSRILAVADVFEALTADRPYRGPMAPADAMSIVRRDSRSGLDPFLADVLDGLSERLVSEARAEAEARERVETV